MAVSDSGIVRDRLAVFLMAMARTLFPPCLPVPRKSLAQAIQKNGWSGALLYLDILAAESEKVASIAGQVKSGLIILSRDQPRESAPFCSSPFECGLSL